MERSGVSAGYQTYQCYLDNCLRSGAVSVLEINRIQVKIFKSGFGEEIDLFVRNQTLLNKFIVDLFAKGLVTREEGCKETPLL